MNLSLAKYDIKVLMAFGETFSEEDSAFYDWLLNNGYPELAALSSAIRGSEEATQWLLTNKYRHYAALDSAIDGKVDAYNWLLANGHDILAVFADAVNKKPNAINWLNTHNLEIFNHLARKINGFRDNQTFDYHKLHF